MFRWLTGYAAIKTGSYKFRSAAQKVGGLVMRILLDYATSMLPSDPGVTKNTNSRRRPSLEDRKLR